MIIIPQSAMTRITHPFRKVREKDGAPGCGIEARLLLRMIMTRQAISTGEGAHISAGSITLVCKSWEPERK